MMYMTTSASRREQEIKKLNVNNDNFHLLCKLGNERQIYDALIYLDIINPTINHSRCLISAVEKGKYENVKVLIKDGRVNPISKRFMAMKEAIKRGYVNIVNLLIGSYTLNYVKRETAEIQEDFYNTYLKEVCKYERVAMLNVTREFINNAHFEISSLYSFFSQYDSSKKHFLDTIIGICKFDCIDILSDMSSFGSKEGLLYAISLCKDKGRVLTQDIIDDCLHDSINSVFPENVKVLLELSNISTLSCTFLMIVDFSLKSDIHKRTHVELIEDCKYTIELLLNSTKVNIWNQTFIATLIHLSPSALILDILSPYFFTKENLLRVINLMLNTPSINKLFKISSIQVDDLYYVLEHFHFDNENTFNLIRKEVIRNIFIKTDNSDYFETSIRINKLIQGNNAMEKYIHTYMFLY